MLFQNLPDGISCVGTTGIVNVYPAQAYNPNDDTIVYGRVNNSGNSTYIFDTNTGVLTNQVGTLNCDEMVVGTTTLTSPYLTHFSFSPTNTYNEFDSSVMLLGILVIGSAILVMKIVDTLIEVTTW